MTDAEKFYSVGEIVGLLGVSRRAALTLTDAYKNTPHFKTGMRQGVWLSAEAVEDLQTAHRLASEVGLPTDRLLKLRASHAQELVAFLDNRTVVEATSPVTLFTQVLDRLDRLRPELFVDPPGITPVRPAVVTPSASTLEE